MRVRVLPVAFAAVFGLLAGAVMGSVSPTPAGAGGGTTIAVTTTQDVVNPVDGVTSLREAFMQASLELLNPATIVLADDSQYTLTICNVLNVLEEDVGLTGDLDYSGGVNEQIDGGPMTVEGNGSTITQSCANDRVAEMFGLGDITLRDLTFEGGDTLTNGGALSRNLTDVGLGHGSFTIERSTVIGSSAGMNGGGVYSDDAVTCIDSTFSENAAGAAGGALFAANTITVDGCTINRNRADVGGGIGGSGLTTDADADISDSTITANRSNTGGANVDVDGGITSTGSVIALSSEPGDGNGDDCVALLGAASDGNNLGGNGCGFGGGDIVGEHPNLMPLGDNGGPTLTQAPVAGSPVINTYLGCTGTDQRGTAVPQGGGCDTGAIDDPAPACTQVFPDVPTSNQFFDDICWMEQMGITTGFTDGSFRPAADITRQSMAAFTFRVSGSPLFDLPAEPAFNDVPDDSAFREDIEWMADEDITRGYSGGGFRPAAAVTRQAMSAFMYRLAGEPTFTVPAEPTFEDMDTDHPFFEEIEWLAFSDVASGYTDGTFRPERAITRQAMASFLHNLAQEPEIWG